MSRRYTGKTGLGLKRYRSWLDLLATIRAPVVVSWGGSNVSPQLVAMRHLAFKHHHDNDNQRPGS